MTACDIYIKKIALRLPEICSVRDLVKVGLYASPQAARVARLAQTFPAHFQMGKKIIIPKESVIEWLNKSKHGSTHVAEETTQTAVSEKVENISKQERVAQCI